MSSAIAAAEPTREELLEDNERLTSRLGTLQAENAWLREQFKLAKHKQFGPSSEATPVSPEQQEMVFNEAEAAAALTAEDAPEAPEPTVETITYRRCKTKGKREAQLADLPVEEVRYELPAAEQVCPQCEGGLHEMGEEVRQEIEIIPAQIRVVNHVQVKYACRHCALHDTQVPVVTAPMPAPAFPHSLASPSAVAYVMNQKFELGLPLYRQEQHFQDLGIELSRQTLANWMLKGAAWLNPLYDRMHEIMLTKDILHADETTVQVLREPGRAARTNSYMWAYRTGRDGPPIIVYDYETTRGAQHPLDFLKGFTGYLHVDGYVAYEKLPGTVLVGCWAHARRKFDEALKVLPPGSRATAPPVAQQGINFTNKLFKIERDLRDATPELRHSRRLELSQPVLNEFRDWLDKQAPLPKSALGVAVHYCQNQWPKLIAFLQDGRLELDNNRCERSIKPFVIGRKNWLFANTPKGARASAIIYSIVETARENGLRPLDYLKLLFEQLPNIDNRDPAALDALLPWAHDVQSSAGTPPAKNLENTPL